MWQVCTYVVKCYAVASQFEGCREKIQEIPAIIKDICRILYYKVTMRIDSYKVKIQEIPAIIKDICRILYYKVTMRIELELHENLCIIVLHLPHIMHCSKNSWIFCSFTSHTARKISNKKKTLPM